MTHTFAQVELLGRTIVNVTLDFYYKHFPAVFFNMEEDLHYSLPEAKSLASLLGVLFLKKRRKK
jgi:hypothetical protein